MLLCRLRSLLSVFLLAKSLLLILELIVPPKIISLNLLVHVD